MQTLTPEQEAELQKYLKEISENWPQFKTLRSDFDKTKGDVVEGAKLIKAISDELPKLQKEVDRLRKQHLSNASGTGVRWVNNVPFVTNDCAEMLASIYVVAAFQQNKLENLVKASETRERVISKAQTMLGLEQRVALSSTEIPLPTVYVPQIVELVWTYGQARQYATVFPLGAGTVKLPRLKVGEDKFVFFASPGLTITERRVAAELVTFTANKAGGLIRIPYEIEEDTFIPLGQFLARYIARRFAALEDETLFLADATATYDSIRGIYSYCKANTGGAAVAPYLELAAGKTSPNDATLDDFRTLRTLVNAAVLGANANGGAYYLNPTMEARLVRFNTSATVIPYRPAQGGNPATLDGFPIRYVGVLQPFTTGPAVSQLICAFGDLSYWYLGERGQPRVETSREVFFATDEVAMRALERIDVEAMAIDAIAAMATPAA